MKFGIGVLHKQLSSRREFSDNRLSALLHLLTLINLYPYFSRLLSNFMVKFGTRDVHIMPLSMCEFCENRLSALLHLRT